MAIPKSEEKYTYEDYLTWPDDERWELIHGIPYDMSPAPSRKHQDIVVEISRQISNYLKDKPCRLYTAPFDVRLESDTVVQPDLSVICDKNKLDDKGCNGAPDVIIEILSPSTAAKDMKIKLALYERHGVKEYWVVEPFEQMLLLFSLETGEQYGKPKTFLPPDKVESEAIKGLTVDLKEVFENI